MPTYDTISDLPPAIALDGTEQVAINQAGTSRSATTQQLGSLGGIQAGFEILLDGNGSALVAGVKAYFFAPFDATIDLITLAADQTGSIVIDLWKCTYAQFDAGSTHPVVADSICGSAKPTISASTKGTVTDFGTWSPTLDRTNVIAIDVVSVSTITKCTLAIYLIRSSV